MMEKEKNEILEMKLKDVLGLKVTFKNEKTNKMNIGIIAAIFRSNAFLTLFTIKNTKGEYHECKGFKDIQLITT